MFGLYVDNFRGFTDQAVSFKDVNFLVGENSTGKSSLLSLIEVLAYPGFWIGGSDFSTENIKLGSFSDLVSAHSDDKKAFTVGFFVTSFDENGELEIANFRVVTYERAHDGLPFPRRVSFIQNNKLICASIGKSSLSYKVLDEPTDSVDLSPLLHIASKEHKNKSTSGYRRIATKGIPRAVVFSLVHKLVGPALEGKRYEPVRGQYNFETRLPDVRWVAPIRAKPERTYDGFRVTQSATGEHIPRYLNNVISKKKTSKGARKFIDALEGFGAASGLFNQISTTRFGKDPTDPFQIQVSIQGKGLRINNVGYGVSQVLPVTAEILNSSGHVALIQQPEVHLHPRAQAALGTLIYESTKRNPNSTLLIETHSDFMIDRFRLSKARDRDKGKVTAQVVFFERRETGNTIRTLDIDDNGLYPEEQPVAFREFFINEELDLLRL
ncbi:AAA family ATPase [Kordiimonas sp.]|uniref:AAA family ATPase n=1 Tax=Kordiimonas sp. TaxID=1970157 RepID=UPI003A93DBB8